MLQALCLVSHRAALRCYMVSMKIEMTSFDVFVTTAKRRWSVTLTL